MTTAQLEEFLRGPPAATPINHRKTATAWKAHNLAYRRQCSCCSVTVASITLDPSDREKRAWCAWTCVELWTVGRASNLDDAKQQADDVLRLDGWELP